MKKNSFLIQLVITLFFFQASANKYEIGLPENTTSCVEDIVTLNKVLVSEDAYIRNGSSVNDNYGQATTLLIKSSTNNNFVRESLMKFDLSNYSSITSAKLFFYGSSQVDMNLQVYSVDNDDWSENSVTWSNSPSLESNLGSVQMTTPNAWRELDISARVQNDFNLDDKIFSIALKDDNFLIKTVTINSKENAAAFIPYLEIEGELIDDVANEARDVYLIIGQSNTIGRAPIEEKDEVALDGVDLFNGSGWESATNPMNIYSTIRRDIDRQELGYSYTFGRTVNEVTGNKLGLVVNARGATSIEQWTKGSEDGYFEAAIAALNTALETPNTTLKGILWHQGERNRGDIDYLDKLEVFINDLRTDLNEPSLPFIVGQISQDRVDNTDFNERIKQLPNLINNTDYVSTDFLNTYDDTHFDSNGQRVLGSRYASKILQMVYGYELKTERVWIDEDVYTRGGDNSNNNYGNETLVRVKEVSNGIANNNNRRGLLKFDLSSINGNIIDANLFLNASVASGTGTIDVAFYETTTNWSESTVTMNSAPNFSNKLIVSTISGSANAEREVYLSEYMQEQFAQSNSIAIGLQSETIGSEQLKITTKEDIVNQDLRPYLLVSYIENLNAPVLVANATNAKKLEDLDDSLIEIKYTNPVSNELKITHTSIIENVTIYSISGQYIFTQEVNDFSAIINVANLSAGAYVFEIGGNHQKISKIFIKQ